MTVKELMAKLEKMNPSDEVQLVIPDSEYASFDVLDLGSVESEAGVVHLNANLF